MNLLQDESGAVAGGPCGDLPTALAGLIDQITAVKAKLASQSDQLRWTGSAATAFHEHAGTRYSALAELVQELSAAAVAAESLQCVVGESAA